MLFLHLTGLSIWLGSLIALAVSISLLKKHTESDEGLKIIRKILGVISCWIHPSGFVVLVSGIIMIVKMGISESAKPLWLHYMEKGGSIIILLSIISLGMISNKKVKKAFVISSVDSAIVKKGLTFYQSSISIFILFILSVIFVVSFKFL